jgi:hypothetical protein
MLPMRPMSPVPMHMHIYTIEVAHSDCSYASSLGSHHAQDRTSSSKLSRK